MLIIVLILLSAFIRYGFAFMNYWNEIHRSIKYVQKIVD